ncbi:MAG: hypothetical protein QF486_06870 [Candidatus Woesearchaeota archaeon]|nr:hypothetical protein [Candidatus Woesearchaeota archaeon]MDP7182171.1 hypothetical protein [Candidatus Woesearchaeota archaeon]MDP7199308.1 hypothetical protein [Candidatus Woesearchaeota archaeon]MDP7647581.1 hypothetical protein [Candidatus Woesearchaeota archaeon]
MTPFRHLCTKFGGQPVPISLSTPVAFRNNQHVLNQAYMVKGTRVLAAVDLDQKLFFGSIDFEESQKDDELLGDLDDFFEGLGDPIVNEVQTSR